MYCHYSYYYFQYHHCCDRVVVVVVVVQRPPPRPYIDRNGTSVGHPTKRWEYCWCGWSSSMRRPSSCWHSVACRQCWVEWQDWHQCAINNSRPVWTHTVRQCVGVEWSCNNKKKMMMMKMMMRYHLCCGRCCRQWWWWYDSATTM